MVVQSRQNRVMEHMIHYLAMSLLNLTLIADKSIRTTSIIATLLSMSLFLGAADVVSAQQTVLSINDKPTIQVIVQASTWKTRGRLLYDIEGSILKKLSLAGFQAIHDATKPHQYQLVVQYDEERGDQYGVELWGTTINATFLLRGAGNGGT